MNQGTIHITHTPGVCGGKACIAGSRIRVLDIYVWHELRGMSPDEIINRYPQLSLADVYAALSHFWDHREEVIAELAGEHRIAEELKGRFPSILRQRLQAADGSSIPS